jgi:hypothetical protein
MHDTDQDKKNHLWLEGTIEDVRKEDNMCLVVFSSVSVASLASYRRRMCRLAHPREDTAPKTAIPVPVETPASPTCKHGSNNNSAITMSKWVPLDAIHIRVLPRDPQCRIHSGQRWLVLLHEIHRAIQILNRFVMHDNNGNDTNGNDNNDNIHRHNSNSMTPAVQPQLPQEDTLYYNWWALLSTVLRPADFIFSRYVRTALHQARTMNMKAGHHPSPGMQPMAEMASPLLKTTTLQTADEHTTMIASSTHFPSTQDKSTPVFSTSTSSSCHSIASTSNSSSSHCSSTRCHGSSLSTSVDISPLSASSAYLLRTRCESLAAFLYDITENVQPCLASGAHMDILRLLAQVCYDEVNVFLRAIRNVMVGRVCYRDGHDHRTKDENISMSIAAIEVEVNTKPLDENLCAPRSRTSILQVHAMVETSIGLQRLCDTWRHVSSKVATLWSSVALSKTARAPENGNRDSQDRHMNVHTITREWTRERFHKIEIAIESTLHDVLRFVYVTVRSIITSIDISHA